MFNFLADVDSFFSIDSWQVSVEHCLGVGAIAVKVRTADCPMLANVDYRAMYSEIYQTINGRFIGFASHAREVELPDRQGSVSQRSISAAARRLNAALGNP